MQVTRHRWPIVMVLTSVFVTLMLMRVQAQPPTPAPTASIPVFLPSVGREVPMGTPVFLPVISGNQPTPTPPTAQATVRFTRINLRALPGLQWPPTSQLLEGTVCAVRGRNEASTWLFLECPGGPRGWVDRRLVTLVGPVDVTPVLFTIGSLAPSVSPTLTAPTESGATPTPVPSPTPPQRLWHAEFFDDSYLTKPPVFTRSVAELDFPWGTEAPHPDLPDDRFSARFTRTEQFSPGYYRFTMRADDGVRFWLDDELLIDGWLGCCSETLSTMRWLDGTYELRVEYFEDGGNASLRFVGQAQPNTSTWRAAYYDGTHLRGLPLYTRFEPGGLHPLDYAWGRGSPLPGRVPADRWSGRWQGDFAFESGNYRFYSDAQDGVRVYINNLLVIDAWRNGRSRIQNRVLGIGAGVHTVTVEYYNRTGDARLEVWWEREEGRQIAP